MKKIPEDIEQLDKKIAEFRQRESVVRHEHRDTAFGRASRLGLRIGVELMSAVIVGGAVGYVLDRVFGTSPWGMAVFLFFGGAAGILNVYRLSKQEENNK